MRRYEVVEIDPATGEVDQVLSLAPATWSKAQAEFATLIADMQEDWDEGAEWSWLRIQPA